MIHKNRGNRRKTDFKKAIRKHKIALEIYKGWSHPLHSLSKGKVHCSCPLCAAKTNTKINKSNGPVDPDRPLCRLAVTNKKYGRRNYKISDIRKIDNMNYLLNEPD